ncbi:MAG TPA: histidinol dehydrogenase [Flavobacteriales bacterium]
MIEILQNPDVSEWKVLQKRPSLDYSTLRSSVQGIMKNVKKEGDRALFQFALQFDKSSLTSLAVSPQEIKNATSAISPELDKAIHIAAENIRKFHSAQQEQSRFIETMPGVQCWRKSVAIDRVGLYIPGGSAPLFSTVLMLAIPAQIAGCKEIILCTPPDANGNVHPAILHAASVAGVSRIFKTGGAQAIAAMAYGTESIPKVDKIFGPGNQYVTCAKMLAQQEGTAIDMPAGPSEVLVIADRTSNPSFVAADLLSQAEHGSDSQVILLCTDKEWMMRCQEELLKQLNQLPRKELATASLSNSRFICFNTLQQCMAFSNSYAPEHLIIACEHAEELANEVRNAGSVFIGAYTPESAGDYASGTNHTLPTSGNAKAYSGVSLDSFIKKITFQKITRDGLQQLAMAIETMAQAEGLTAHKNAVSIRLNKYIA